MKVRMLVGLAGLDFSLKPGEETERFPKAEALRMVDAGIAVPVVEAKTERASRRPAAEKRG